MGTLAIRSGSRTAYSQRGRTGMAAVAVLVSLMLTGCGGFSLLPTEAARIFDLSPKSTFPADLPTVNSQLVVQEPTAARALNTDRIAVRKGQFEVGYFKGVRWSDQAPRMIQIRLIESFENSHRIGSVGRRAIGLTSNFDLLIELREFQAEMPDGRTNADSVIVTINAKLVEQPSAFIVASRTFEMSEPTENKTITGVVGAFDEALGSVLKDIVTWSLGEMATVETDPRSRGLRPGIMFPRETTGGEPG